MSASSVDNIGETIEFGVIYCSECGSRRVDSGFKTTESSCLMCCSCGNVKQFRVGKVDVPLASNEARSVQKLLDQAYKDAFPYPPNRINIG